MNKQEKNQQKKIVKQKHVHVLSAIGTKKRLQLENLINCRFDRVID